MSRNSKPGSRCLQRRRITRARRPRRGARHRKMRRASQKASRTLARIGLCIQIPQPGGIAWRPACKHSDTDISSVPQIICQACDHIEIAEIKPDITRVTLSWRNLPVSAPKGSRLRRRKGWNPARPFGPNLRALVVYLRFTQGISFERLAKLLSDLLGLDISEGALVNMLEAARHPLRGADKPDPRASAVWNRDEIGRDRPQGRQAELVAVGLPPQAQRRLRGRALTRQSRADGLPGPTPSRLLGLGPLRRPSWDGRPRESMDCLSPSHPRRAIRHRRGRRASLHLGCAICSGAPAGSANDDNNSPMPRLKPTPPAWRLTSTTLCAARQRRQPASNCSA